MKRLAPLGLASLASLALMALMALMAPGAATAADVALVIGNHDYQRAPDALSARADARAVADALEKHGYQVTSGTDLDRAEMRRRIAEFAGRLDGDGTDRVVVFYSGHALRSGGDTYLAPIDQGNGSLVEVMMDGVPLDLVLRLAGQEPGQAVVFIDGAQLDGFTPEAFAEPGLADIEAPEGVLVVSAAAPGRAIPRRSTGQSAFGRQVVEAFLAPGVSVGSAVRKTRSPAWVTGDTDTGLVLVPEIPEPVASRVSTDTPTATAAPDSGAAAEQRLGLTRAERRRVQGNLTALGYDTRGIDGIFGPGTRTALRRWQRANDFPATGYLTAEQVSKLSRQRSQTGTDTGGRSAAEVEARLNLSASERSEIQEQLNTLGYDARGTGGTFGSGTRTAIRNWQRTNDFEETGYLTQEQVAKLNRQVREAETDTGGRSAAEIEARLDLSASERSNIQERLTNLGYDTRGTDGRFGSGTRTAIRNWQRANGFEETGYLTGEQVSMIYRRSDQAGREAPEARDPAAVEDSLGLTRNDRLSIEQRLAHLGFPPGEQDGFFDGNTRQAIESYQRNRDHRATGYLDRDTVAGIIEETRGARSGIVEGAQILQDLMRGLVDEQ